MNESDVVKAEKGTLDLRRGSTDEGGFRTEVALYDPQSFELMGVATFRVSDRFFVQLSNDVRRELMLVSAAVLLLLALVWAVLIFLLAKVHSQRRELVDQEQKYQRLVETLRGQAARITTTDLAQRLTAPPARDE